MATNIGTIEAVLGMDVRQFVQGAQQAQRTTKKLEGDITAGFRRIDRSVQRLTRGVAGIAGATGIGALAVAVVKAATELETLERGLEAVSASTAQANRHMRDLRELAKLPGLGFQEAVRGAVAMRALGTSVEVTNRTLREFSNAVTLSGGGQQQLAGVITQINQMAAAGRILQADLRPIIQQAPVVGRALKQAFGTIDPQEIEALGLSFEEFRDRLLDALEDMPRAAETAQTTFENFGDALKQLGAEIGDLVLPPLIAVANAITDILEAAEEASERTKRLGPTSGGLGILAQQATDRARLGGRAARSNVLTGAVDPVSIARVVQAFNAQVKAAEEAAEAERKAKEAAEAAARAAEAAAKAQAERVAALEDALRLNVNTNAELQEAVRLEGELAKRARDTTRAVQERVAAEKQLRDLREAISVATAPAGGLAGPPGLLQMFQPGGKGVPFGGLLPFAGQGELIEAGRTVAQGIKDEADSIGQTIGAGLASVVAGLGAQIGGPAGGAIAGAAAGISTGPVGSIVGAGLGALTGFLGLFNDGLTESQRAAADAARALEQAAAAFQRALASLEELAAPSGPLESAVNRVTALFEEGIAKFGVAGLDPESFFKELEFLRSQDPFQDLTAEQRERLKEMEALAEQYAAALAEIEAAASADLEVRLLTAQGRDAEAAAARLAARQAAELADAIAAGMSPAFLELLAQVHEAEEAALRAAEAEKARQEALQRIAFDADVAARLADVTGQSEEAARIRREAAAAAELAAAQDLVEQGVLTEEQLARLADVLELELAKAAADAAEAVREAAAAQERAAAAALEDLEVRRLLALGQDQAAADLRFQLQQQRELEEAIREGASQEFIDRLREVQDLERAARERALTATGGGGGAGLAADAAEAVRSVRGITETQALRLVDINRSQLAVLQDIRALLGGGRVGGDVASFFAGGGPAPQQQGTTVQRVPVIELNINVESDDPFTLRQFIRRVVVPIVNEELGGQQVQQQRVAGLT